MPIIKSFIFVLLITCTLSCIAQPTIMVLGDSLSANYRMSPEEGWVSLLAKKLILKYPTAHVINSSIVGDTTANSLQRLPSLLSQYHPHIVIVELGGNDGLRGLPIAAIKKNLSAIIKQCLNAKAKVLLINIQIPPNYGKYYTQQFESNYKQLSEEYSITLAPFFLKEIALNPNLMLEDKIHPKAEAQPLILEQVLKALQPLLLE